jgi:hypothetical protein
VITKVGEIFCGICIATKCSVDSIPWCTEDDSGYFTTAYTWIHFGWLCYHVGNMYQFEDDSGYFTIAV